MDLSDVREINHVYWPRTDEVGHELIPREMHRLGSVLPLCRNRRIVVQAGGNVGLWPLELSKHFGTVFTFEPDPINYYCLVLNTVKAKNILSYPLALADVPGFVAMSRDPVNCGAHYIRSSGTGIVEPARRTFCLHLDALGLDNVDFLQFDVEGYELQVLRGAYDTISRCWPVIMIEEKHAPRYGQDLQAPSAWLTQNGYEISAVYGRDVVLVPK